MSGSNGRLSEASGAAPGTEEETAEKTTTTVRADVVVVGGTASGVGAAITAARLGLTVVVTERTDRLGGMISHGVSKSDVGRWPECTCGIFHEFRNRVRAHYGDDPDHADGLKHEPKVAAALLRQMVEAERGIRVLFWTRPVATTKSAAHRVLDCIVEGRDGARTRLLGRVTLDCSDEADVATWAGCTCRVGREPRSVEEPHAGVIYLDRGGVHAQNNHILHRCAILPGSSGAGDASVQGYSFLMTLKDYGAWSGDGRDTRPHVLRAPPANYSARHYEHAVPWERSWGVFSGKMPGGKHEANQYPYGVEAPGEQNAYPEGTEAERAEVIERHKERALGYLYYLQHVEGKTQYGLPTDEYEANGGFPLQLYVREGRRIIGHYVFSEADLNPHLKGDGYRPPTHGDAIAVGHYSVDVHPHRPKRSPDDPDSGEGELLLPRVTAPSMIPYRCLVPLGVEGLLVPHQLSATHLGYNHLRLEPTRMACGAAAAYAAFVAIRDGVRRGDGPGATRHGGGRCRLHPRPGGGAADRGAGVEGLDTRGTSHGAGRDVAGVVAAPGVALGGASRDPRPSGVRACLEDGRERLGKGAAVARAAHRVTRRWALFAAPAAALVACGMPGGAAGPAQTGGPGKIAGPLSVRSQNVWNGPREPLMQQQIAAFKAVAPEITIQNEVIEQNGMNEKMRAEMAAGTPADVVMVSAAELPSCRATARPGSCAPSTTWPGATRWEPRPSTTASTSSRSGRVRCWGCPRRWPGATTSSTTTRGTSRRRACPTARRRRGRRRWRRRAG